MSEVVVKNDLEVIGSKIKELILTEQSTPKEVLVCSRCKLPIADAEDRVEMEGGHEHLCMNSHGYSHHFRCYEEAPGCAILGEPTGADSWFPCFSWQIALCSQCEAHLGWLFTGSDHFYGLLVNKIRGCNSDASR